MRNQPDYHLFKNTRYALQGFVEVLHNETSFKIEVVGSVVIWVTLIFLSMPFWAKAVLGLSLFPVLIAELANSAIERVVDLVTQERRPLAKHAKDAGATMVLFSLIFTGGVWAVTLYLVYFAS
ncbi:diacylglycerol kinase [Hydrogenimonas sp. SS33]|uniref:diacylglycerol kinase n=1 Tax=Hydrogenimonas leucolamina TaxID=2954236 RepID=UPI00336BB2FD